MLRPRKRRSQPRRGTSDEPAPSQRTDAFAKWPEGPCHALICTAHRSFVQKRSRMGYSLWYMTFCIRRHGYLVLDPIMLFLLLLMKQDEHYEMARILLAQSAGRAVFNPHAYISLLMY